MPYLVTNSSYFEPFSYEELVAPIQQMSDAHNAAADAYAQLDMETQALNRYIGEDDVRSRELYDNYMSKLQKLQDNLWNNGYNASTRRDLASARASYASDITRLSKAIETRQAKSQEYWKYKHEHPEMIMGADPGRDSLDDYLLDDQHGNSWYQYSGEDFKKQVSEDAKNRINEILNLGDSYWAGKDPYLKGYLLQMQSGGYSSEDVDDALAGVAAVLAGGDPETVFEEASPGAAILGKVLYDNLLSTGALDAGIDSSELARMLRYGKSGLSSSIKGTNLNSLTDLEWASQNKASGTAKKEEDKTPYEMNEVIKERGSSRAAAKITSRIGKSPIGAYDNNGSPQSHTINVPAGYGENNEGVRSFDNWVDATKFVYHDDYRDDWLAKSGLDVAYDPTGVGPNTQTSTVGGREYRVVKMTEKERERLLSLGERGPEKLTLPDGADCLVQFRDNSGEWKTADGITLQHNIARQNHLARQKAIEQENAKNGTKLSDIALSPEDEAKLRKKYNIPRDASFSDIATILYLDSGMLKATDATLADKTTSDYLEQMANSIIDTYLEGGQSGKNSRLAFHRVYEDGTVDKEGVKGGIDTVFAGTGKNSGRDAKNLRRIELAPELLEKGQVLITTETGQYAIDAEYLGSNVWQALNSNVPGTQISLQRAITELMTPLQNPRMVLSKTESKDKFYAQDWQGMMASIFSPSTLSAYGLLDENGDVLDPKRVLRNENTRNNLRKLVTGFIAMKLGYLRDEDALRHYERTSNTGNRTFLSYSTETETE